MGQTYQTRTIADLALAEPVDVAAYRSGAVGGAAAAEVQVYGADDLAGEFLPIQGATVAKQAGAWAAIPEVAFMGPRFVKLIAAEAAEVELALGSPNLIGHGEIHRRKLASLAAEVCRDCGRPGDEPSEMRADLDDLRATLILQRVEG